MAKYVYMGTCPVKMTNATTPLTTAPAAPPDDDVDPPSAVDSSPSLGPGPEPGGPGPKVKITITIGDVDIGGQDRPG